MDSLELNKAFAAVLLAGMAFVGAGLVGQVLVRPKHLEETAIKIDLPESAGNAAAPEAPDPPIAALLVSADVGRGESAVKSQGCVACHSFNQGGKAGVGPNLYNTLGSPHGHMEGYSYSAALKSKEGPWTFDEMDAWLKKPSAYAPGTKMSYAGLSDAKKRADIIAYIHSLSTSPIPLPPAPAEQASAAPASAPTQVARNEIAAKSPEPQVAALLASADVGQGEAITKSQGCVACHTFKEGGKAGVGPNLYNTVGSPHGHMEGYSYSAALKAKEGPWTFDELDAWLKKPSAYAPGTKMGYAGLADPKKRADVIAYLRSLSPDPVPLPPASATGTDAAPVPTSGSAAKKS